MRNETTGCAELDAIKAAFQQGDGGHWGVSDFYPDGEAALRAVLEAGYDFDTEWYSVKKEIQSARIIRAGDRIECEVSCSDDFDTDGMGLDGFNVSDFDAPSVDDLLAAVINSLDAAADLAEKDRRGNQVYVGYSVGPVRHGTLASWAYTYIAPTGAGYDFDEPPGDNYHTWGWQDEPQDMTELPDEARAAFEEFVQDPEGASMIVAGWGIFAWEGAE